MANSTSSSSTTSDTTSFKLFDINKAIESISRIKTPIQMGAFFVLLFVVILLYNKPITVNFLLLFIFVLPFALIILLFSEKAINLFKTQGNTGLVFLFVLLIAILGFSIMPIYYVFTNPSLLNSNNKSLFANEFSSAKAQETRKNQALIANYVQNYDQISNFFFAHLNKLPLDSDINNIAINKDIQLNLKNLSVKISSLKGDNTFSLYGDKDIQGLVSKLQASVTDLNFSKYIFTTIYSIYSSQDSQPIYNIIDIPRPYFDSVMRTDESNITTQSLYAQAMKINKAYNIQSPSQRADNRWAELQRVGFSKIEGELIKGFGKEIVLKKIKDISETDVKKIIATLSNMGVLDNSSSQIPISILRKKFFDYLSQYAKGDILERRFFQLAFYSPLDQFAIYICLYKCGLIDFNKFIVSFCPQKIKPIMAQLLSQKLTLFTSKDAMFLKTKLDTVLKNKKSQFYSAYIINDALTAYQKQFGNKVAQTIVQSDNIEGYVVESIGYMVLDRDSGSSSKFLLMDSDTFNDDKLYQRSSKLMNAYKDILVAVNLVESNLLMEADN